MRSKRTLAEQVDRATNAAYRRSRRPRRSIITMVPAAGATPERMTQRSVVVPFTPRPLDWEQARECGKAYGRVLSNLPKYDREFEAKLRDHHNKIAKQRQDAKGKPKPERYRRVSGMWWLGKLADLVEKRTDVRVPSYSRRYKAKAEEPAPAPKPDPIDKVVPLAESGD